MRNARFVRSGRGVAVLAVGLVVAGLVAGEAGGGTRFLTKKRADKRYVRQANAGAFLDDVKVVVETVEISNGNRGGTVADCPAGYEAVGGGVAGSNVLPIEQSQPDLGTAFPAAGTYEQVAGWRGHFGNADGDRTGIVLAVCAR